LLVGALCCCPATSSHGCGQGSAVTGCQLLEARQLLLQRLEQLCEWGHIQQFRLSWCSTCRRQQLLALPLSELQQQWVLHRL
jgi:hypothetical protein